MDNKNIPTLKQRAKELYLSGMYCKEVAKIIGCHTETIRKWMVSEGVIRHRGPKSMIGDENYFDNINTPEKAYWLGWLMADGCVTDSGNIKLNVALKDKKLVDDFLLAIQSTNKTLTKKNRNKTTNKEYASYWCSLTSIHMVQSLNKYGVVPRKSDHEIFPLINKEFYRDFIRGYFDGDGCVYIDYNHPHFTISICGSKEILTEINGLFKNLGKIRRSHGICELRFDDIKYMIAVFYHYFYDNSNLYLERKYKIFKSFIDKMGNTEVSRLLKQFATVEHRD